MSSAASMSGASSAQRCGIMDSERLASLFIGVAFGNRHGAAVDRPVHHSEWTTHRGQRQDEGTKRQPGTRELRIGKTMDCQESLPMATTPRQFENLASARLRRKNSF